jgi:UDP-N-acetylglucosamine--N-acetylmuramyl-(pentapeptide) pyrophosphoryl-undecaprenol N-acetylglucosamine transferase
MNDPRPVLLAAGGTGGHLFPAEALARALAARRVPVELVTDARAIKYGGNFPARAIHQVASATPTGGGMVAKGRAALALALGTVQSLALVHKVRPRALVGFGGYPTVPPVLAASLLGVPAIVHEQNAVMGRANRFLVGRVDAIATGFAKLGGVDEAVRAKALHTGNPVRPSVVAAAGIPYPDFAGGRLKVLITGGSQGARVMSDVVPAALAQLSSDERARIDLVQQARGEDEIRVHNFYTRLGFEAEVAPFFADLPRRIAEAHLVIGRSGASTVSELAVIGRPSVLVPLPHALDQDQAMNAAHLGEIGAAIVVDQKHFTPTYLAEVFRSALADHANLDLGAKAAKSVGIADAAERLADYVLRVAAEKTPPETKK